VCWLGAAGSAWNADYDRLRAGSVAKPTQIYHFCAARERELGHRDTTASRYGLPFQMPWLGLFRRPQAVGDKCRERLSGRLSPADAERMPGWVRVHLMALGGIEIRSGLE
jgi:hypothetical protein